MRDKFQEFVEETRARLFRGELKGLTPKDIIKYLTPEQILKEVTPEQLIGAMSPAEREAFRQQLNSMAAKPSQP